MRSGMFGRFKSYAVGLAAALLVVGGGVYSKDSQAAPCSDYDTYDQLVAAGTCEIGDKTFDDFTFQSIHIDASDISVTVYEGALLPGNPEPVWGFKFQFGLFQVGDGAEDFSISYAVHCTDGAACIDSIHAAMTGGSASDFGVASLSEHWVSDTQSGDINLASPGGPISQFVNIDPTVNLGLTKDILVGCDLPAGSTEFCSAQFSVLVNTVDQTEAPEPGTLALLAVGLLGLGFAGRRRNDA